MPPFRKKYVRGMIGLFQGGINLLYIKFMKLFARVSGSPVLSPTLYTCFHLPPTENVVEDYKKQILRAEQSTQGTIYCLSWLYRNSTGIEKYRPEILKLLAPKKRFAEAARRFISERRAKYQFLVGVHIRKGDLKEFAEGQYYFHESAVRPVLEEFLRRRKEKPLFIICSDEAVDKEVFSGLEVDFGPGSVIEDLLVLSLCDLIIGSNSSFGGFASYYGNVPRIIFQRDGVDWEYYLERTTYFEDKYFCFNQLQVANPVYSAP